MLVDDAVADTDIAVTIAEVRGVYEGCWWDRALAFAALGSGSRRMSSRQRIVTRDAPSLARNLRRVALRVEPSVVEILQAELGRCVPRDVLYAIAGVNGEAAQLRRAAEVLGRKMGAVDQ